MKKNKSRIALIILSIIILLITSSCGSDLSLPEPSHDFYVYDEVNIINENTKRYIIDVNNELYEKTGAQIVVAAVDSLQGLEISSYSLELYEKWKIGSKEYDNGILILIAPNDNSIWIEIGYGLEGQLTDSQVKKIIRDHMIPSFSKGEYSEGVISGFNQILLEVEGEYDIILEKSQGIHNSPTANNMNDEDLVGFPRIFMIIGIMIFLFIDFTFFRGMIIYSILRGIGRGGGPGGSGGRGGSSGGGGRSGGGGAGGSW